MLNIFLMSDSIFLYSEYHVESELTALLGHFDLSCFSWQYDVWYNIICKSDECGMPRGCPCVHSLNSVMRVGSLHSSEHFKSHQ